MSLIFALKGRQGDKGDKGDQGDKGDKGDKGDTGETGFFTSCCSVHLSDDQTIPTGTWTKVLFNTKIYDADSEFDIVTHNRFTAKVAGLYTVLAKVQFLYLGTGHLVYAKITKNGTAVKENVVSFYSGAHEPVPVFGDVPLDVGEYIELWALHNHPESRILNKPARYTFMDIHQIR